MHTHRLMIHQLNSPGQIMQRFGLIRNQLMLQQWGHVRYRWSIVTMVTYRGYYHQLTVTFMPHNEGEFSQQWIVMVTTTLSVAFITMLLGHLRQGECCQDTINFLWEGNNHSYHTSSNFYFMEGKPKMNFLG